MKNKMTKMDGFRYFLALGAPLEAFLQNYIIDFADYFFTWVRDFQVGAAVLSAKNRLKAFATKKASDSSDNHSTLYDKLTHHNDGSLTHTGDAAIGLMVGALAVGTVRAVHKYTHSKKLISVNRLAEQEAAVKAEGANTHTYILDQLTEETTEIPINDNDGVYKLVITDSRSKKRRYLHVRRRDDKPLEDATLVNALNATKRANTRAERFLQRLKLNTPTGRNQYNPLWWINMTANSKIGGVINSVWNFLINSSMVYWIAWYFAVVAKNITLSMHVHALTATLGITAAFALAAVTWKAAHMIRNYHHTRVLRKNVERLANNPEATLSKRITAEQKIILRRLINLNRAELNNPQRKKYAIKQIADAYEKVVADEKAAHKKIRDKWIQNHFMTFEHEQHKHRAGIEAEHPLNDGLTESELDEDISTFKTELQHHLHFKYRTKSTHTMRTHAALGVLRKMIVGFVIPFFMFALVGAIAALAPHVAIMVTIATVMGNNAVAAYVGVTLAGIIGIKNIATARNSTNEYHQTIKNNLNATMTVGGREITKQDYFLRLEKKLQAKLNAVQGNPAAKARMQATGYPLDKIDVYNDDYFCKQRTSYGKWVKVKKTLNRILDFTGGTQTGILVTRFIFLSGMVAAGALTAFSFGAPLAFIGLAIAAGAIVGGIRFMHAQLQRRKEKSLQFATTIDQRITYMKNRMVELDGFMNAAPPVVTNHQNNDDTSTALAVKKQKRKTRVQPTTETAIPLNNPQDNEADNAPLLGHEKITETTTLALPKAWVKAQPAVSVAAMKHNLLFKPAVEIHHDLSPENTTSPVALMA